MEAAFPMFLISVQAIGVSTKNFCVSAPDSDHCTNWHSTDVLHPLLSLVQGWILGIQSVFEVRWPNLFLRSPDQQWLLYSLRVGPVTKRLWGSNPKVTTGPSSSHHLLQFNPPLCMWRHWGSGSFGILSDHTSNDKRSWTCPCSPTTWLSSRARLQATEDTILNSRVVVVNLLNHGVLGQFDKRQRHGPLGSHTCTQNFHILPG